MRKIPNSLVLRELADDAWGQDYHKPADNIWAIDKFKNAFAAHEVSNLLTHNKDWTMKIVLSLVYARIRRRGEYCSGVGLTKVARLKRKSIDGPVQQQPNRRGKGKGPSLSDLRKKSKTTSHSGANLSG